MRKIFLVLLAALSFEASAIDPLMVIECKNQEMRFDLDIYRSGHSSMGLNGFVGMADLGSENAVFMRAGHLKDVVVMRGYGGATLPIYYTLSFERDPFLGSIETRALMSEKTETLDRVDEKEYELICKRLHK